MISESQFEWDEVGDDAVDPTFVLHTCNLVTKGILNQILYYSYLLRTV